MTLVGLLREKLGIQKALTTEYDPEFKNRMNTLRGAEGTTKGTTGFDKYFGPRAETHTDHPVSGRAMRKAVASVNAYWGIYGIYREGFYQADNDRLARNPIFAICEKGIMDYLGIVEWEVIDHQENRVERAIEFLKRPNPQDTFPTLLKMTARDMIRYDAGAWVKTLSEQDDAGRQVLLEFKAYSGPEFWIEIDRDWRGILGEQGLVYEGPYSLGYVKRYWQHAKAGVFIPFDPKEVVYFCCYPRADSCYGTDFMQQLKWYLEYLIDSTKAAGMTFANGIMPGMKYKHPQYTSVAQLIEANAELDSANLGPENFNGIVNLIGEEDIEPLTPTMVDMQWLEGQMWVAKIVWAMFGFSSSEFVGDDVNRATAYVARNITKSRMLSPLLRKFEEMINENILPDIEGWESGWKFKFKDVVDLDDELKQAQIDQSRATAAQSYMQMGVPLEAALRIVGVEDEKIERAVRAMEEAQEDAWNQGMEGGGGPMGPPGPDGGLNTNPQGGQQLSPEEAAQYYADTPGDMGPQMYHREDYQGAASSQDHEGSDEDQDRIQKAQRIYLRPGQDPPEGSHVHDDERGGRYYLGDGPNEEENLLAENPDKNKEWDHIQERDKGREYQILKEYLDSEEGLPHAEIDRCQRAAEYVLDLGGEPTPEDRDREFLRTIFSSHEAAAWFFPGDGAYHKEGDSRMVQFSREELIRMNGAIFIHNHPTGSSFSLSDIITACRTNFAQIRAVSPLGVYIMRPQKGKVYFSARDADEVEKVYREADISVYEIIHPRVIRGELSIDQAERDHVHMVWEIVSKHMRFQYVFKEAGRNGK